MSEPLTAQNRLQVNYTVAGVAHKLHLYVRLEPTLSADPTGFDLCDTVGVAIVGAKTGIDALWTELNEILDHNNTTVGVVELQVRSGTIFNPIGFYSPTITLTTSAPYVPAGQFTVTLRTTGFKRFKVQIMESIVLPGDHYTAIPPSGHVANFLDGFVQPPAVSPSPGLWIMNRNARQEVAIGGLAAATADLNDKLRRKRGIL